mmetsp:Transcript_82894/g.208906  ORF Transcript_82894/g.208906 Transcript_82894/m.208906 type:complete len:217 (+) Transcript_82894:590-1240(+)
MFACCSSSLQRISWRSMSRAARSRLTSACRASSCSASSSTDAILALSFSASVSAPCRAWTEAFRPPCRAPVSAWHCSCRLRAAISMLSFNFSVTTFLRPSKSLFACSCKAENSLDIACDISSRNSSIFFRRSSCICSKASVALTFVSNRRLRSATSPCKRSYSSTGALEEALSAPAACCSRRRCKHWRCLCCICTSVLFEPSTNVARSAFRTCIIC